MPTVSKRRENGQRIPKEIRERFEAYAELQVKPKSTDDSNEIARKRNIEKKLEYYNTVIHSLKNNSIRASEDRAKYLTMQSLPDYMEAVELPYKTFFEFCMKENKRLNGPDDEGWKEISWPTAEMKKMAGILDDASAAERKNISELIDLLQPAYYCDFRNSLRVDSGENLPNGRPVASRTEADSDIPVLWKENNLGDRMAETLGYLCNENHEDLKLVCKKQKLAYSQKRTYASRHYWSVFSIEDIWRFCKVFSISPHWAMFGPLPVPVLTQCAESELIMDEFSFLPIERQKMALTITEIRREGQNNGL